MFLFLYTAVARVASSREVGVDGEASIEICLGRKCMRRAGGRRAFVCSSPMSYGTEGRGRRGGGVLALAEGSAILFDDVIAIPIAVAEFIVEKNST